MLPRWREQSHIFEQVEAHWEQSFALRGAEEPEIMAAVITGLGGR